MAIADTINSMKTNITNAYNTIQTKGGTIPTNKNLENLSTAINSISTGGSGGGITIEEISTAAEMSQKLTVENVGKVYKFHPTTYPGDGVYTITYNGSTYDRYRNDGETFYVVKNKSQFDIERIQFIPYYSNSNFFRYLEVQRNFNFTGCDIVGELDSGFLSLLAREKFSITAVTGYKLPETITATNCSYVWTCSNDNLTATLELYNAVGDITVTIIATAVSNYGQTPTNQGLWNLFGDNNFRGAKNLANVFDDNGFMSDFISNYSEISGGATSYWTQFIEDLSAAGDIVKSASKGLTDKDFDNITGLIQKAFSGVSLTVKFATSSASEFMKDGYMIVTPVFGKNGYDLYLWLIPAKPYAPLD